VGGHATIALDVPLGSSEWLRRARRARRLASFSLAWLCFEGAATTAAGLLAGSIALVGNGLDGAIEGLASVIVIWRFSGSRTLSISAERRAQQLIALSFFLLAPYIAVEASRALLVEHHAETTWLGIGLSIGTLCVCPWLGRAKLQLGEQLGSPATVGEGRQNLICAYLAVAVLAGLLANTLLGIWWLDPVVALAIAMLAISERRRAWRGESCGCSTCSPTPGDNRVHAHARVTASGASIGSGPPGGMASASRRPAARWAARPSVDGWFAACVTVYYTFDR
jgi:cation efflux family protein